MEVTTLSIDELKDARRFRLMLEEFDLSNTVRNEPVLARLITRCRAAAGRESNGDNYIFVDAYDVPFTKAIAVQLGLAMSAGGQWMVIPCYEPHPHCGGDQWEDKPTMIRLSRLGTIPGQRHDGLQAFRPCKEWAPWW